MRNTIFWNDRDPASTQFVRLLRESGLLAHVSFTSFQVRNPKEQEPGEKKLLQILEIDTLPTLFFEGQAFHGRAAYEWVEYQCSTLRNPHQQPEPPQRAERTERGHMQMQTRSPIQQEDVHCLPADDAIPGAVHFDQPPEASPGNFGGTTPFNIVTSGNVGRAISDDALRAAEASRESMVTKPVNRT